MLKKITAMLSLLVIILSFAACKDVEGGEGNGVIPASTKIANEFALQLPEFDFSSDIIDSYDESLRYSFSVECGKSEFKKYINAVKDVFIDNARGQVVKRCEFLQKGCAFVKFGHGVDCSTGGLFDCTVKRKRHFMIAFMKREIVWLPVIFLANLILASGVAYSWFCSSSVLLISCHFPFSSRICTGIS